MFTSIKVVALIVGLASIQLAQSKKTKEDPKTAACHQDECQLSRSHFALYYPLKKALETNFDINGKEIIPLARSYEILSLRFAGESTLNGSAAIKKLLMDEKLAKALEVFQSEEGRRLVDLYRSSIDGKGQNLACSQWRIKDIKRAGKILESNAEMAAVFGKINENFVRKSAKKCFKKSCVSIDTSMSEFDSILAKKNHRRNFADNDAINELDSGASGLEAPKTSQFSREMDAEEQELCRFFKRSNETNCHISNDDLSKLNFKEANHQIGDLRDRLESYHAQKYNSSTGSKVEASQLNEAARQIAIKCRSIRLLSEYNLSGLRWYIKQNLIDEQKLAARSAWCPSLTYWVEMDRLCGQLENLGGLESFPKGMLRY